MQLERKGRVALLATARGRSDKCWVAEGLLAELVESVEKGDSLSCWS